MIALALLAAVYGPNAPGIVKPSRTCETPAATAPTPGVVVIAYVVRADGTLDDVSVKNAVPGDLAPVVVKWLRACKFSPGTLRGTGPVDVRDLEVFRFADPESAVPQRAARDHGSAAGSGVLSAAPDSMSRPRSTGACKTDKPSMPARAIAEGISGLVLVEFVIHADGHAGEIVLRNKSAPPILFDAVKEWLEGCTFTPSILESTGQPVPVKMVMPFHFGAGSRR